MRSWLGLACLLAIVSRAAAQEDVAGVVGGSADVAAAPERTEVNYTLEPTLLSAYINRGDLMSTTLLEPVVQPYLELSVAKLGPGDLVAGVASTRMLGPQPGQEIGPYVSYGVTVGFVEVRPGYTLTWMPAVEPADTAHEFTLETSVVWDFPVTPYASAAVDPLRTRGFYAACGLSQLLELDGFALETTLNFGASDYWGLSYSLQDITLSTRGQLQLGETGYYAALVAASAWSGRSSKLYPYSGLALGYSR